MSSSDTNMLLQSINANISNAIKRIDGVEQVVTSLNYLLGKLIENQQTEIELLQKLVENGQSRLDVSEPTNSPQ